ncbi:Uncharacterised protein [Arcanobacterium haemolyticum]|nr:Uncharacterised protein [Arcanobacterium haemolyticum]
MRLGSGWGGSPVVVNLPRIGSLVGWAAAGTESAGTARKPDASVPTHFLRHRIKLCQQRITNRRRRRYRPSPKNSATLSGISTFGAFFFITPPPKFSSSVPNHPESGFSPCPMEPADAPQSRDASHRYKKRVCLWTWAAWPIGYGQQPAAARSSQANPRSATNRGAFCHTNISNLIWHRLRMVCESEPVGLDEGKLSLKEKI